MTEHDGEHDEALTVLEEIEAVLRRMIVGVFRFIFIRLPTWVHELFQAIYSWLQRFLRYAVELFRAIYSWLQRFLRYAVKFCVRLARILFFAVMWVMLVFGPLAATTCLPALNSLTFKALGAVWFLFALIGSLRALYRWRQQRGARLGATGSSSVPPKSFWVGAAFTPGCAMVLAVLTLGVFVLANLYIAITTTSTPTPGPASAPPTIVRIEVPPNDQTTMSTPPARPDGWPRMIANSIGMKLVLIPAGEFLRGSPDSDGEAESDEKPQHRVQITQPFYLGVCEVTQAEYEKVVEANPSEFNDSGGTAPVELVSWDDAVKFCQQLSSRAEEQAAGRCYRLPTEAEWEYACRAASTMRYGFGESRRSLDDYAWYNDNAGGKTHPVGQKKPNAWGLYDMQGNVWEWCSDGWDIGYYNQFAGKVVIDPGGPPSATDRVLRGGSWNVDGRFCRPACRDGNDPGPGRGFGFRVALGRSS